MDRVLSARIDDAVYRMINDLSARIHTSKKAIIETAVRQYSQTIEQESESTAFDRTCGAWVRDETAAETVSHVRKKFNESLSRHRK